MNLTTTQHSALGELKRYGSLRPSSRAFSRYDGRRTFSRRTLQALVDAGVAEWRKSVRMTRHLGPITFDGFITPIAEPEQEEAQLSRGYSLGVPLVITVHPDGRVEFDVDLSEVPLHEGREGLDESEQYSDDCMEHDQRLVDTVLANMRHHHSF